MPPNILENDKERVDFEQTEIALALRVLSLPFDRNPNGSFNKKVKEIDAQLLNMGSNHRTIDILSTLSGQLLKAIDTLNALKNLNKQGQTETARTINTVKPEIIEEDGQRNVENCNQMEVDSSPSVNPKKTLPTTPESKNQDSQNSSKTLKSENPFYSSSESEEESEEEQEKENMDVQQHPSPLTDENCVGKLEEMEEETVEIIPELEDMSIEEIERKAAENAKRNKRIRYFSSDSEEESSSKKKRKKTEKSKKRDQISKSRQDKNDSSQGKELGREKTIENQTKSKSDNVENSSSQELTDTQFQPEINEESLNGNDKNLNGGDQEKQTTDDQENQISLIGKFIEDAKQMTQTENDEINKNHLDTVNQTERIKCVDEIISKFVTNNDNTNSTQISSPLETQSNEKQHSSLGLQKHVMEKTIKHVLEFISDKIFKQIEDDFDIMTKNAINTRITEILIKTCKENIKFFLDVKLDIFLVSTGEISLGMMVGAQQRRDNKRDSTTQETDFMLKMITLKMNNRLKELCVKNSAELRNSFILVFNDIFKYREFANGLFKTVICLAKSGNTKLDMFVCKSSKKADKLFEEAKFLAIFKEITEDRVKFLEFVKKKVEYNYEIDF